MTTDDHAKFIDEQYRTGQAKERTELPKRQRMARAIQSLLASAEMAAQRGDEAARDDALAKASALQLKFAIDDAMSEVTDEDRDTLAEADFCTESNTPLIKAKRQLIASLADLHRGRAVMMGDWKEKKSGGMKWDARAKVRVWAHQSDLDFITALYNSLIVQMQTMMAADERVTYLQKSQVASWRVSYAYGWVGRVVMRIREAKARNEAEAETGQPGTALVLRDRTAIVNKHVDDLFPRIGKANYRIDDKSANGRAAGRAAAERADIGNKRVGDADRPRLQA